MVRTYVIIGNCLIFNNFVIFFLYRLKPQVWGGAKRVGSEAKHFTFVPMVMVFSNLRRKCQKFSCDHFQVANFSKQASNVLIFVNTGCCMGSYSADVNLRLGCPKAERGWSNHSDLVRPKILLCSKPCIFRVLVGPVMRFFLNGRTNLALFLPLLQSDTLE